MALTNEKIILETAFRWECPNCHWPQYEDAGDVMEMSPKNRRLCGIPAELEGELVAAPEYVKCDACGLEYGVDFEC